MENPLISVVLPCYNAQQFLPDALESIVAQTYKNLEIICINDGSDDKTPEILESYAQKDNRIRVIHNETNIKLIRTLNKGIDLAKGEYIARMDADDVSLPNRIETEYDYLKANPHVDIVSCGIQFINENNKKIKNSIHVNEVKSASFFASFFYTPIIHASLLGKTSVFKKYKYSTKSIALHTEDSELWGRMLLSGVSICNISDILYKVRINSNSVSNKFTSIQDNNYIKLCQQRIMTYFEKKIGTRTTKIIVNRMPITVNNDDFRTAISEYSILKRLFINNEKINCQKDKKAINEVYYSHLLNICIQALLKTNLSKFLIISVVLRNSKMLKYAKIWKFLLNKVF